MNYYSPFGGINYQPQSLIDRIKNSFKQGSSLTRLIYINIGVYLCLKLISVLLVLTGQRMDVDYYALVFMGVPADVQMVIQRPWTLFTYMFTQLGFFHLLFNMLWLHWFGRMFLTYFNSRKLAFVYVLGGLFGALLYILAYNTLSCFTDVIQNSVAIGASGSVMAIVFAVCFYAPNERIYLFLFGQIKLLHLALISALLDVLSIPSGNAGGHIAHLGGALFGILFVAFMRSRFSLFKRKTKKPKMEFYQQTSQMSDYEYNASKKQQQDKIDEILDKISRSGYESLTREEKELLFKNKS